MIRLSSPRSVRRLTVSALLTVSLIGAGLVAGCDPPIHTRGALPQDSTVAKLKPGENSRDDVRRILGAPSTTSLFDNGETWYYIGSRQRQTAFFPTEEIERHILVIRFAKTGLIDSMAVLNKEDGTRVVLVDRRTPTVGHTLTILEQILGNIGRFEAPK